MQLSFLYELGIVPLTKYLVGSDCDSVRQIEASDYSSHRHSHTVVVVVLEQFFGQALCFLAENEVAVVRIFNIRMSLLCFCRKIVEGSSCIFFKKFLGAVVKCNIEFVPVIKSGSFHLLVRDMKAHRTYKMKSCARCGAGASNISRVLRNFGLN